MSAKKQVVVPTAPTVYVHPRQPAWGHAIAVNVLSDRATYLFEHGGERTFMQGSALVEVALPTAERESIAAAISRVRKPPVATARKRTRGPSRVTPFDAPTFDQQLTVFRTAFPGGFGDPRYVTEERGTATGEGRKSEAAILIARETLSRSRLETAIRGAAYRDVVVAAQRLVTALRSLALPKTDVASFERLPEARHEAFARALLDLLHGEGELGPRFDALAESVGKVPWTIATLFAAAVHPTEHAFVKPTLQQRQARAIGAEEPEAGDPSGEAYAQHRAIALATRDRLIAAGLEPRDLLDVYAFSWRTLTRATASAAVRT